MRKSWVLDHHQMAGALPAAVAVVNPNREDDLSGQGHLCAAGVVFLSIVRTARLLREAGHDAGPDLLSLLDLVALATVCDVVPLTGVNRAFVVKGLQGARQMTNPGLAAVARTARNRRAAECVSSRLSDRSAHQCGRADR